MSTQTFTFESYVLRGANEREWPVTVTYQVTPGYPARLYGDYPHPAEDDEIEVIKATISSDTYDVTDAEYDSLFDEACMRADDDMADYYADAAEFLAELAAERRAAA